jgi:deoxyhypusine monooxygenase
VEREGVSKSARKLSIDNLIMASSDLQRLEDCLLNKSGEVALHTRFRALFTLKNLKSEDAVEIIAKGGGYNLHFIHTNKYKGFNDPSALLKHELAYCLGQIKMTAALATLESVLRNKSEDPMVRHEVCGFQMLNARLIIKT